jgi:hypothetical protein
MSAWVGFFGFLLLLSGCLLLLSNRGALRQEYFFDEAWRADIVRSRSPFTRYRTVNAPIPPLWVGVMWVGSRVAPDGFQGLRVQNLLIGATFPALVGMLAAALASDGRLLGGRRTLTLAAASAGVGATVLVVYATHNMGVSGYLNDYMFQSAAVAAFVLTWLFAASSRRARRLFAAGFLVLPLATISGLFVLPAASVWWVARDIALRGRFRTWALVLPACSLATASFVYVVLYRSQVDGALNSFWGADVLRHGSRSITGVLGEMLRTFAASLIPREIGAHRSAWAGMILVGLGVLGLRALFSEWRWVPVAAVSSLLFAACFSIIGDWPVTAVRVNVPLLWMYWLAVLAGVAEVLSAITRLRSVPWTMAALVLVVPIVGRPSVAGEPFARGLYGDLSVIGSSPVRDNIVVSYHSMSHFYVDDALVNGSHGPRRFAVIREVSGQRVLFDQLDAELRESGLRQDTAVWCVVPYESGPVDTALACRFNTRGRVKVVDQRMKRAVIVGWFPE